MLAGVLFLLALFIQGAIAEGCSETSRCAVGCCNKFGWCGFGPSYCGDDCASDCDRKSECDPGHGKEWSAKEKCPLNVCCSKYGFCGTTKDFCGDKKVERPSCPKDQGVRRVIGYYEGWSAGRVCSKFYPEQIPTGVYTHINFAFATIDSATFQVAPAKPDDTKMYARLTHLKKIDPKLKIFVAIGGWTFNDEGPTRTTFSDLAASISRQETFIKSLVSFMATYGFDGVDLDWEYPGAEDRGGRPGDYANFPKFLSRLKIGLAASGGNKDITLTLPCSYWYLQHFDLQALVKEVSWFNIMSYDMHGTWDIKNKYVGPYLNAHTNLTEIMELGLDLLWRNQVPPEKVVLGVGFYGRAFTATSPACLEPSCTYESGADRGDCSREPGILMNSEIDDIVAKKNIKTRWYKDAAVKVASWDNQWVAYDDEETLKQKSGTAQSMCLGGLMVWAISHDTMDGKYSRALAKVSNRVLGPQPLVDDEPVSEVEVPVPQCKWTNCDEPCPSGWVAVGRSDGDHEAGALMHDQQHCEGPYSMLSVHTFCCPPNAPLPQCGWYTHHNGRCDPQCPPGKIEIGSNNMYCNNGKYQAACCTFNTKSMRVYTTCEWGAWPNCDDTRQCPWSDMSKKRRVAGSTTGSGGALCLTDSSNLYTMRLYCCNDRDWNNKFGFCNTYTWVGSTDRESRDKFCYSGCPADLIRVGMDERIIDCRGKAGAAARCCEARVNDIKTVENPILSKYRQSANNYANNPVCPAGGYSIVKARQQKPIGSDTATVESLLLTLLTASAGRAMLDAETRVWDNTIGAKFTNLKLANLKPFLQSLSTYYTAGPLEMVRRIICNPDLWNLRAGRRNGANPTSIIDCSNCKCMVGGDGELGCADSENPASDRRGNGQRRRHAVRNDTGPDVAILKQATSRDYTARVTDANGGTRAFTITLPANPPAGGFDPDDPIYDEAVDFEDPGDCLNSRLTAVSIPTGRFYETEHPLDAVLVSVFITQASQGLLPNGATMRTPRVSASFFLEARTMPIINAPPLSGGLQIDRLYPRIMECLGSELNRQDFVLAFRDINQWKTRIVMGKNIISEVEWKLRCENWDPTDALHGLRTAVSVIHYLNRKSNPDVQSHLAHVVTLIYLEWQSAEVLWNLRHPNDQVRVAEAWAEWVRAQGQFNIDHTRSWMATAIKTLRGYWAPRTGEFVRATLTSIEQLEAMLPTLTVDLTGFPTPN